MTHLLREETHSMRLYKDRTADEGSAVLFYLCMIYVRFVSLLSLISFNSTCRSRLADPCAIPSKTAHPLR